MLRHSIASVCVILLGFGLVMVFSASTSSSIALVGTPYFFVKKQAIFICLAVLLFLIASHTPLHLIRKAINPLLVFSIVTLGLVLMIGLELNGAKRWLNIGFFNLQVSELFKLCFLLYTAHYLARKQFDIQQSWRGYIGLGVVFIISAILLLAQPDYGTVVLLVIICLGVLFISGIKWRPIMSVIIVSLLGLIFLLFNSSYRVERLKVFLEPWDSPFGSGYQITQSLIAFGSGGWFGAGLGNGVQKLFYLPDAYNDFIFAVIAEELGIVGAVSVILMFIILFCLITRLALRATRIGDAFAAYFCHSCAWLIFIQASINISSSIGMMPTKGITLPLISYGGSSLMVFAIMIGILYSIDSEISSE